MKDGLYHVNFQSNQQDFGDGVVTVKDNHVSGGDYAYFYQGVILGDSLLLNVNRYNDQATSVFGPATEFNLELKINQVMGFYSLEGHVQGQPQLVIKIKATTLAGLI